MQLGELKKIMRFRKWDAGYVIHEDHGRLYVNFLLGRNSKISKVTILNVGETQLTKSAEISNAFNDPEATAMPESFVKPSTSQFEFNEISVSYFHTLLHKLSLTKSCGINGTPPKVLNDAAEVINIRLFNFQYIFRNRYIS